MEIYGLKQRKKKKWWLIPIIIIGILLVFIWLTGLLLGSSSPNREAISAAVSENAELKRQIEDLNSQVASLREQLASAQGELTAAQGELAARPVITPEPPPAPDAAAAEGTSPRNYEG